MANGYKTGGRTKGTLNRTSAKTKEIIQKVVSNELDNIENLLDSLEPYDRINVIIKLLPYIVPKQKELFLDKPEPITISFID